MHEATCPHPFHNDPQATGACFMCGSMEKWEFAGYGSFSAPRAMAVLQRKRSMTAHIMTGQLGGRYPSVKCNDCEFRFNSRSLSEVKAARDAHLIFTHTDGGYVTHGGHCGGCNAVKRQGGTIRPNMRSERSRLAARKVAGAMPLEVIEALENAL